MAELHALSTVHVLGENASVYHHDRKMHLDNACSQTFVKISIVIKTKNVLPMIRDYPYVNVVQTSLSIDKDLDA